MTAGGSRKRMLTPEDRALWQQVVTSVRPLRPAGPLLDLDRASPPSEPQSRKAAGKAGAARTTTEPYHPPVSRPLRRDIGEIANPATRSIDDRTQRKLARGRMSIDATIDLHGMAQSAAHAMLIGFVDRARHSGARTVLVITGKGRSGEGVLRHAVPRWLAEAPLAAMVTGWRESVRAHGGEGALYVRLRKRDSVGHKGR